MTYLGHELSQGTQKARSEMTWVNFVHPSPSNYTHLQGQLAIATNGFLTSLLLLNPCVYARPPCYLRAHFLAPRVINFLWSLKGFIVTPPALNLPHFDKPFHRYCQENKGIFAGQHFTSQISPKAYFPFQLDPVAAGMVLCLCVAAVVAVAAALIAKASTLTLGSPLGL